MPRKAKGDGGSGEASRVDEDPFEEQMRHTNEASAEQLIVSTAPRYVKPQALDQLEEWMEEKCRVRMWRQFHGCHASGGGIERVFFSAGK